MVPSTQGGGAYSFLCISNPEIAHIDTDMNTRHNDLSCMSRLCEKMAREWHFSTTADCVKHTEKQPRRSVGNYPLEVTKTIQTNSWSSLKINKLKQFPTLNVT